MVVNYGARRQTQATRVQLPFPMRFVHQDFRVCILRLWLVFWLIGCARYTCSSLIGGSPNVWSITSLLKDRCTEVSTMPKRTIHPLISIILFTNIIFHSNILISISHLSISVLISLSLFCFLSCNDHLTLTLTTTTMTRLFHDMSFSTRTSHLHARFRYHFNHTSLHLPSLLTWRGLISYEHFPFLPARLLSSWRSKNDRHVWLRGFICLHGMYSPVYSTVSMSLSTRVRRTDSENIRMHIHYIRRDQLLSLQEL